MLWHSTGYGYGYDPRRPSEGTFGLPPLGDWIPVILSFSWACGLSSAATRPVGASRGSRLAPAQSMLNVHDARWPSVRRLNPSFSEKKTLKSPSRPRSNYFWRFSDKKITRSTKHRPVARDISAATSICSCCPAGPTK